MRDVAGFEGLYAVTEMGHLWSYPKGNIKKHNGLWKAMFPDHKGYLNANLRKDGKSHTYRLHRLVAQTFIPNPENKPEVNHKDGNKLNNCVGNLEWCTAKENQEHARKNGLHKTEKMRVAAIRNGQSENSRKAMSKTGKLRRSLSFEQAEIIREDYAGSGRTQRAIARKYNIDYRLVWKIIHKTHYKEI